MCFGPEATPPPAPRSGQLASTQRMVLSSAEGGAPAATLALTTAEDAPGVVLIPDVRGLHPYYDELARRFAEAGVHAVAIDLYSRTAGTSKRGGDFEYEPHVLQLQSGALNDDVVAAATFLRTPDGGEPDRLYTIGFCIGGRISLLQAAAGLGLAGVIGLYPWPVGPHRSGLPAPAEEAPRFGCGVLTLYGGADAGIPAEAREAFARALAAAGVEHRSVVYPDAPHSFFDRKATEFADASEDAWRQILGFMGVAA
jgi:carboxymethylenebutenolidase